MTLKRLVDPTQRSPYVIFGRLPSKKKKKKKSKPVLAGGIKVKWTQVVESQKVKKLVYNKTQIETE